MARVKADKLTFAYALRRILTRAETVLWLKLRHGVGRIEAFLRSRSWQIVGVSNDEVYRSIADVLKLIYQRSRTRA